MNPTPAMPPTTPTEAAPPNPALAKGSTIGFLGAGNMAGALVKGLLAAKVVSASGILVSDVSADRLSCFHQTHGVRIATDNHALVRESDILVLAVKPQVMGNVLEAVGGEVRSEQLVISVAAGVPTSVIESQLPKGARVIRSMPNAPATVLAGATAIARGSHATDRDLEVARAMFAAVGCVVSLDESLLDAATGLSGSGPAYVMLMIEALADGGVKVGLPRATALLLAAQTVLGSAKLLLDTGEHPGRLKDMVTSPGGTSIAGLAALESGGLRSALINAVEAATLRAHALKPL